MRMYVPDAQILVVGLKADLKSEIEASLERSIRSQVRSDGWLQCSALTENNVENVFNTVTNLAWDLAEKRDKNTKGCPCVVL